MNQKNIGEIIFTIRNNNKIQIEEVCQGLCSVKEFSKIEKGIKEIDVFLLNALLQRMGTSTDKLELFISIDKNRRQIEALVQKANEKWSELRVWN